MGIHDRDYYQDEPQTIRLGLKRQSFVTKIIIVNVAVFLLNMLFATSDPGWLMKLLANHPSDLGEPWRWWTLLTCGFAHDYKSINHILSNMLGLYFLGPQVEERIGSKEFLAFYLVTIVLASLASDLRYWFFVDAGWPYMLGASGAVVGVVILYALYYPKRTLLLMFVIPMPAWGVAIIVVLMAVAGAGEHVAHDVHLAGAALAAAYYYSGVRLTSFTSSLKTLRRPKLRVVREDNEEELIREGDRLLAKVHREGEESLTNKERKTLERYSRFLRRQRES